MYYILDGIKIIDSCISYEEALKISNNQYTIFFSIR